MGEALERPALYYPYIHIRSEHWLKATLLCVPAVKRIVPEGYTPEDQPSIVKYTQVEGPSGALLQEVPSFSPAAHDAQWRLMSELQKHENEIKRRYARPNAPRPDRYWVHDAKFNYQLLSYLRDNDLAWHSTHSHAYGKRSWYALHPALGSAIMTTLGLSIAHEQHYDIVTPSNRFHETLLATKEGEIFSALLSTDPQPPTPMPSQARQELGQLVITLTGVNYQALRPEDIPELQASKHFRKFQHLIRTAAQSIDRDNDPKAYEAQLKNEAHEIIEAWQESRKDVNKKLKGILFEQALTLSPEALEALIKGRDETHLALAGGVAIALLVWKGLRLRESRQGVRPYQYLTEITRAQDEHLRMTFPLGLEK